MEVVSCACSSQGDGSALWAPPGPREWSFREQSFWEISMELPGLRFKPRLDGIFDGIFAQTLQVCLYTLIPLSTLYFQTTPEEKENKHY